MADGDQHVLFAGRSHAAAVFAVQFRRSVGSYQVNLSIYHDAGASNNSGWETIADASHYLEIDWQAATGAGANNGSLALYIDGTLERTLSGIDNDTLRVDEVRLGPSSGLDSGTAGTYYLDGFESRRSTYTLAPAAQRSGVGPLAGLLPGGRSHPSAGSEPALSLSKGQALAALRHSLRSQGRLLPQASQRNPGFFARLTTRMHRALAAAFLPGMLVQPAAAVLGAPPAGQAWKVYYHAPSLVAMREITAGGSVLYYLHQDHLGSTSLATNASGAEVPNTRQSYFPYGAVRVAGVGLPTDRTFTGQYADASTGLYFYNARYYSSAVGRFVSADTLVPDPANPQSFNRLSYVRNNPLRYVDPTGYFEQEELARLLGFGGWVELEGSELWSSWSQSWKDMLLSNEARMGSILSGIGADGSKIQAMFAQFGPGEDYRKLALWDPENREVVNIKTFLQAQKWALYESDSWDGIGEYRFSGWHSGFDDTTLGELEKEFEPTLSGNWYGTAGNSHFALPSARFKWRNIKQDAVAVAFTVLVEAKNPIGGAAVAFWTAKAVINSLEQGSYFNGITVDVNSTSYRYPGPLNYCSYFCFGR